MLFKVQVYRQTPGCATDSVRKDRIHATGLLLQSNGVASGAAKSKFLQLKVHVSVSFGESPQTVCRVHSASPLGVMRVGPFAPVLACERFFCAKSLVRFKVMMSSPWTTPPLLTRGGSQMASDNALLLSCTKRREEERKEEEKKERNLIWKFGEVLIFIHFLSSSCEQVPLE